jgi:hypothetical protein
MQDFHTDSSLLEGMTGDGLPAVGQIQQGVFELLQQVTDILLR